MAAVGLGVYSASNKTEYQNRKNNVFSKADNLTANCEPIV
jgi:hypothetical protein